MFYLFQEAFVTVDILYFQIQYWRIYYTYKNDSYARCIYICMGKAGNHKLNIAFSTYMCVHDYVYIYIQTWHRHIANI